VRILLFILILSWFSLEINAQHFNFQNFSVREGLAQSQVYAMIEDSRGFIWAGTQGGGLSRFDGYQFTSYSSKDGLANNYIHDVYEDAAQNIWIGTSDGLSRYDGWKFTSYRLNNDIQIRISCIQQTTDVTLWIGSSLGLYQFKDSSFIAFPYPAEIRKSPVHSLFVDQDQKLWVGTETGVFCIENQQIIASYDRNDLASPSIRAIAQDDSGRMWFGSFGGGIYILEQDDIFQYSSNNGLNSNLIHALLKDDQGQLWFGSQDEGLGFWNPTDSTFQFLTEDDGLPKNDVRCIIQDSWHNIWVSTSGGGIAQYAGQQFVHYDRSNGLYANFVYAIEKDTLGQLWLGASEEGFSIFTDTSLVHYGRSNSFADVKVKSILRDRNGRMWIGTEGKGLAYQDTTGFQFLTTQDGLGGNWIRAMVQDTAGYLWVATGGGGLSKITDLDSLGFEIERFGRNKGLPDLNINDLHLDQRNRIWIATRFSGLACLENDTITQVIRQANGLASDMLRSLAEDSLGMLWIGTTGRGVSRLNLYADTLSIASLPLEELRSGNVYLLQIDDEQNLWMGTESGVDKISLDEERNFKDLIHYGVEEGFEGIETCRNAVLKDEEGNIYFGTVNGLTKYFPEPRKRNEVPPKLLITDIRLFYESLIDTKYKDWVKAWGELKPNLELKHKENHLGFEFRAINYTNPEKVTYQWKLEGLDADWSPASSRNDMMYANLAPGSYTFLVRAINEDGVVMITPRSIQFTILPPFWELWWFRLSGIAVLVLMISGFIRWRINTVKRKAKEEQEKLALEKNLLELEQKALQLQMNPHFIFNTLNSIQGLIAREDPQKARYYLAKFSKLMRATLENSRESLISLAEEIQVLQDYLSLEQFSRNNAFQFEIQAPEKIDLESILLPPMMIQPFVENAVVHGVAHIKEEGQIGIDFKLDGKHLECTVTDNGIGLKQARKLKGQIDHQHKSMALQVTQERLEILSEGDEAQKSLEIKDLVLPDGSIGGTKVILQLPIRLDLI
jgi:ligand-binding sensor domain-containing protein